MTVPSTLFDNTRSICPRCKVVIDAELHIEDGRVVMRKRCERHGAFEALISSDAELYRRSLPYNKPGTLPLGFSTEVRDGCPADCGLCPDHQQHTCLRLIEVNSHCNLDCPICFANAGPGFSLTLAQVERMLDRFIELEGEPEVVQFSGGEPTLYPDILRMIRMTKRKGISVVISTPTVCASPNSVAAHPVSCSHTLCGNAARSTARFGGCGADHDSGPGRTSARPQARNYVEGKSLRADRHRSGKDARCLRAAPADPGTGGTA